MEKATPNSRCLLFPVMWVKLLGWPGLPELCGNRCRRDWSALSYRYASLLHLFLGVSPCQMDGNLFYRGGKPLIHKTFSSLLVPAWSHLGVSSDQGDSDFPPKCVANQGTINSLSSIKWGYDLAWISLLAPQLWVCRSKELGCYTVLQRMSSAEGNSLQFMLVSHWAEKSWGFSLKMWRWESTEKPQQPSNPNLLGFKNISPHF